MYQLIMFVLLMIVLTRASYTILEVLDALVQYLLDKLHKR